MISRRQAIASGAILVLLGLMVALSSGSLAFWNPAANRPDDRPTQEGKVGTEGDEAEAGPAQTKRSVRDMGRKPTLEETQDLLRTTIVSKIDVEDATLEETVVELNRLSRSHGISERELTFVIGHRLSTHLRSSSFRVRELRIRNVPLVIIPKYVCDRSILRCRVSPGRVTFGLSDDFDEPAAPSVMEESGPNADPFAEPGEERAADPDDPSFPADSEEADPFAEPE